MSEQQQDLCRICVSDEGGFLPMFKNEALSEIHDNSLSNKICHKCAFEIKQCSVFIDKISKLHNKKFAANTCNLCFEPCTKNNQTLFKLSRLNTKDRAFLDRAHNLFNKNVYANTHSKSPCVCLNCRYSVDLLYDLKNLANEADSKFANIKNGIDVSNVPKTKTLIINRKTTSIKSAVLHLTTPSSSDSDSFSSMGSSKRPKKLRKTVAVDSNIKCEQCKTAITSDDTYKIHKTGVRVCKQCWHKYSPIKTNMKSKSKRKMIEYPLTKWCSILVDDVLKRLEEKGYNKVINKKGAVCYKVMNSNNMKAQSPESETSGYKRLSKSSRNKSRTPELSDELDTPLRSTRAKRRPHSLELKEIESSSQRKGKTETAKQKKPDSPAENKKSQNKRNYGSIEVDSDVHSDVLPSKRLRKSTNLSLLQTQKSSTTSPRSSRRSVRKREHNDSLDSSSSSRKSSRTQRKQNYREIEEVIDIEDDSNDEKQEDLNSNDSPNQDKENFKRPRYNRIASSDSDSSKVSDSGKTSCKSSAKVSKRKKMVTSESEEIDILKATDDETRDVVNETNKFDTTIEMDTTKTDDDDDDNNVTNTNDESDVFENSNVKDKENSKRGKTSRRSSRQSSIASSTQSSRRSSRKLKSASIKVVESIEISDTDEANSVKEETEQSYTCKICDKVYENKIFGLQHELTHMEIKLRQVKISEIKLRSDSDADEHHNKNKSKKETTEIIENVQTKNLEQSEQEENNINSENENDECVQDVNMTNESNDRTEEKEQDKSKFNNANNIDKKSTVEIENIDDSKSKDESEKKEKVESEDESNSVDPKVTDSNALSKENDVAEDKKDNSNLNEAKEVVELSKNKSVAETHGSDSGDDEGSPLCEVNSVSPVVDNDEDSGGRVIVNFDDSPQPTENENATVVEKDESHVTDTTAHDEVQQALTESDELVVRSSNNTDIEMTSNENEVENTSNTLVESSVTKNDRSCKEVHENGNESRQGDENNDNNTEDEALNQESLEELMRRKGLQVVDEVEEDSQSPKKQIDIEVDTKVIQQNVDVMEEESVHDGLKKDEVQELENNVQNCDIPTL
ncbi:protein PFC0760c-like [Trichogramma pretiosum]|uniref:protein PFC0760c-like n=1 Tax=Trichogramma pretiosum TaxID=7493 RepID=UPI0006C9DA80|nr:protein PFC0760c-like [Trichogramma pretiosum]